MKKDDDHNFLRLVFYLDLLFTYVTPIFVVLIALAGIFAVFYKG